MRRFGEADDPRRRVLIRALAAGFFSGSLASREALAQVLGSTPAALPPGRSIYRIEGQVLVDGQPATLETRVGGSATVETAANSEVVYAVGESAFIQRSESHVTLATSQPDSVLLSGLHLLTGKILSVFPSGRAVRMTTKNATIGIRGTGVYMESDPEQTYFCTCYGVADVGANGRSGEPGDRAGHAPRQAALHPDRGAARREHPRRAVHQPHRPGTAC